MHQAGEEGFSGQFPSLLEPCSFYFLLLRVCGCDHKESNSEKLLWLQRENKTGKFLPSQQAATGTASRMLFWAGLAGRRQHWGGQHSPRMATELQKWRVWGSGSCWGNFPRSPPPPTPSSEEFPILGVRSVTVNRCEVLTKTNHNLGLGKEGRVAGLFAGVK